LSKNTYTYVQDPFLLNREKASLLARTKAPAFSPVTGSSGLFYVFPAAKLPPGHREPSEEASTPLPGQESAEEEDAEEEESVTQKDSQKVMDKSQGAQQLEGNNITKIEALHRREEWIVRILAFGLWVLVF
jgi:hypothetical protein